jgi:S-methyl-5-thioribose-1-phosphate isomerase
MHAGAPLIAIVACLGLAVDLKTSSKKHLDEVEKTGNSQIVLDFILTKMDYLQTSRPTAVNLFNAMEELRQKLWSLYQSCSASNSSDVRRRLVDGVQTFAEFAYSRDENDNRAMGAYGADELLKERGNKEKISILTICNTGSLATATYGTALGVVRAVHERRQLRQIVALETRPYNQGSRLTAFELVEDGLPGMLICDGMAASFIKTHGIDAVVIGADRVCANGDTANKIGSYNLSLVAAAHQVPVYVVAPFTTLDITHPSGDHVVIEERPPCELIESSKGPDINVWNPSFDITPARYIAAIITEKGIIRPAQDGTIDVAAFVRRHMNDEYSQSENGSEHFDESIFELRFAGDTKRAVFL